MSAAFQETYAKLRELMLRHANGLVVAKDEPGDLVVRTLDIDPRTGERGWFGTVSLKRSYVAYHLMPLYGRPEMLDGLSAGLSRRRQGKTCFNFTRSDEALFDELSTLTARARELQGLG
ncbi:hypothetical protein [Phenylobacterium sp.]|jgi:hypothetical protein|uniref:hypothetical protein n=1 Tax=Phenylobacterium sp. TaxID=1871053 RepID=UPI002F9380B0